MKTIRTLLCLLCLAASGAGAQTYPERPIYWVVPWAAGGASDTLARIIGEQLGAALKQPVVVNNQPGAGGNIGTEAVSRAQPDGYTLVQLTDATTISPSLYPRMGYDPVKGFAPVTLIATGPHAIVVGPAQPYHTVKDLVDAARARPGEINFATAGVGSAQHLAGELFNRVAKVDMVHIPYKGGGQAIVDVLSGQVAVGILGLAPVLPYIRAGKLRAIAVTGKARSPVLPDVPTVAESGYPGFESVQWFGLAAPAGTPAPIVAKLNAAVSGVLRQPDVARKLADLGAEVAPDTPEQFTAYMREDIGRWASIIKQAGVKLD